jgi:hypothetical protein
MENIVTTSDLNIRTAIGTCIITRILSIGNPRKYMIKCREIQSPAKLVVLLLGVRFAGRRRESFLGVTFAQHVTVNPS